MNDCDCAVFSETGLLSRKHDHFEYRPGQLDMCRQVAGALKERAHLAVEAGTGTGKTLAYLVPAAGLGQRTIISTGTKNLQDQLFYKDIPFLRRALLKKDLRACCIKGRGNYLCRLRFDMFSRHPLFDSPEDRDGFLRVRDWLKDTPSGDRGEVPGLPDDWSLWQAFSCRSENCIGQKCPVLGDCFLTRIKKEAVRSDLIIVNHHLLMADLSLKNAAFGEVLPSYAYLILDEAHLVEEIATNYFGYAVSNYRVDELLRDIRRDLSAVEGFDREWTVRLQGCKDASDRLFDIFSAQTPAHRFTSETSPPGVFEALDGVRSALFGISAALGDIKTDSDATAALERRAGEISEELGLILRADQPDEFIYWSEQRKRAVFLRATPIRVDPYLRALLFEDKRSVVLTSATLAISGHFDFIKKRLGVSECRELILPSEFDYTSQCLFYIPPAMPDPRNPAFTEALAREILQLLEASGGRAFVLFTSFANLRAVLQLVTPRFPYPLLVQGERPKDELLEAFRKDTRSVLFATTSFWQGVDVQGESLSCVIIDKLPFAVPTDPLTQGKMESIQREGGNPFLDYQVPGAVIMLKQGLGRLIRNRSDRGVLALLDRRIVEKRYGRIFLKSLPPYPVTHEARQVRRFFECREGE
jgi:ATP-dependent DNA helicase DinG